MPQGDRGQDHSARQDALNAFMASVEQDVQAGIAQIGDLDEPIRLQAALGLLIQNDKFQDAIDLIQDREIHTKWVDLAVYAFTAKTDFKSARQLIETATKRFEDWVASRCRISFAEAVFAELLSDDGREGLTPTIQLSDTHRIALRAVVEELSPVVEHVRIRQSIEGTFENAAVEYTVRSLGRLGELSRVVDLVDPLARCSPVPLILAQMALRRVSEPPPNLAGRLRIEHPESFTAHFLAALLDREIYGRQRQSLDELTRLRSWAQREGVDAVEALSQVLFETATALDDAAVEKARRVVDELNGTPNEFELFFEVATLLRQGRAMDGLALLNEKPRETSAVWWQMLAVAHERSGQVEVAATAWQKACDLMPHPDLLRHFAGLNLQQKKFSDAVVALETARAQSPEDTNTLEQLATAYIQMRRFSDAASVFEKLTQLRPDTDVYKINLAICRARSGAPDMALKVLDSLDNRSNPNLELVALRCAILNCVGRFEEAFECVNAVKDQLWNEPRFLLLFMNSAYRAGKDDNAQIAFRQLIQLKNDGIVDDAMLKSGSLEELLEFGRRHREQHDVLMQDIVKGKLPWLFAESIMRTPAARAWYWHTQKARWLSDDPISRGGLNIYATNGFSVFKRPNGSRVLDGIEAAPAGSAAVADMSALLTLFHLGMLTSAVEYLGVIILPATYEELQVRDSQTLAPHQPSREQELHRIRDFVERKAITISTGGLANDGLQHLDEHDDSASTSFGLADLRFALDDEQKLTTEESEGLARICHQSRGDARRIDMSGPIVFGLSTLRILVRFEWFERIAHAAQWRVSQDDYDHTLMELHGHALARTVFESHNALWSALRALGTKIQVRSCDRIVRSADGAEGMNDREMPVDFDAAILAVESGMPLLADDRVCQSHVLNQRPDCRHAAFGTDRLLIAMAKDGVISWEEVSQALLQMLRWRYRFLCPPAEVLKILSDHSKGFLPGPELRAVAAYMQDSLRDSGLLCGPEKADPATPVAFRLFMDWQHECCRFLAAMWTKTEHSDEQLELLTRWSIEHLLPAIPRGLLYSPLGRRLGSFTPTAFMMSAMLQFTAVQPLQRANKALRVFADALSLTDDEFFATAAEAADGKYD